MKKKILFVLLCLFIFSPVVNAEEVFSDFYQQVAPNGVLDMTDSIVPTTEAETEFFMAAHFAKIYNDSPVYGSLDNCNEGKTECDFNLYFEEDGEPISETHKVQIKWHETDSKVKKLIDDYVKALDEYRPEPEEEGFLGIVEFDVTDLSLINYYGHIKSLDDVYDMNKVANYSKDLKEMFGNGNISYYLDMRAGGDEPFTSFAFGGFTLSYDGVLYGFLDQVGIKQIRTIYIPDETENTKEAYIAAAKARIDEYMGNTDSVIEVAGLRSEYEFYDEIVEDYSSFGEDEKLGDYYYNVTIGDVTDTFLIIRDSSKVEKPKHETTDMSTDISISSTSSEVPLDTQIKVEVIEETSDKFKEIVDTLKVENAQVYDLKLYSDLANKFVSKLESGDFKVSVPISENLKGKTLIAYYINDNKEVVEHEVTVEGDKAVFLTDHFSVYTIAEKEEENSGAVESTPQEPPKVEEDKLEEVVPPTLDNVMSYVILGFVGVIGMGSILVLKKKEN